jgi:hypothetical protein
MAADRYPTCAAFAAALEASLNQQSEAATHTFLLPAIAPRSTRTPVGILNPAPDSGNVWLIGAGAFAAIAAVAALLFWPSPPPQPASKPAPAQITQQPEPSKPPEPQATPDPPPAKKATIPVTPAPKDPPPQHVPSTGTLVWSGELEPGQEIDFSSAAASVTGKLPGVPVTVEVHPSSVHVATAPGPENGWRRLVLQNGPKKQVMILVRWSVKGK